MMATHTSCRAFVQPAANQLGSRPIGGSTRNTRQLQRSLIAPNHPSIHFWYFCSAKHGHGRQGVARLNSKGQPSTACRATGVLSGPAAAGRASAATVGEGLLRRWLGVADNDSMPIQQETSPLRDSACDLTVCGASVESKGRKHIVLAFVIVPASSSNSSSKSSSGGLKITDLQSPVLHWGCVYGKGDRWQAPPPGWSTWPDVSHDARHGAWQTPFAEQQLPDGTPALTLLLQLPCEGPIRQGGLAFLVKAASNKWLGNAATFSDFYYSTGSLPLVPSDIVCSPAASTEDSGLQGPSLPLDMERLASTPLHKGDDRKQRDRKQQDWRNGNDNNNHHHSHQHAQEPELPNAGRRAKEPANDETQVCTLSAEQLHSAASGQLAAWLEQQHDLELPEGGVAITKHEWPVKGHPSTPFVAATAALWRKAPGQPQREAVLLMAALGDVGLTGKRAPGLVLQWSAVGADGAASVAARPDAAASGEVTVAALPDGWSTLPDMSWDAGSGFWDTPMTRHLFKPAAAVETARLAGMSLDRPTSPAATGATKTQADMYMVLMRLPLQDVFCSGGLLFNMRTSRRQWVRHATTSGPFFLDTSEHAKRLGIAPLPAAAAEVVTDHAAMKATVQQRSAVLNTTDQAAWDVTHAALTAAGLSEEEIVAYAASMPPSGPGLMTQAPQNRIAAPSLAAVLSTSADAELAAHITTQSMASRDSDSSITSDRSFGSTRSSSSSNRRAGGADAESASLRFNSGRSSVAKFLREFEPEPLDLSGVTWGLSGEAATSSEYTETPDLPPNPNLVRKIAELEHKACRSLMHRYGIAADLVQELLPDIHAAAQSAPASLTWPPTAQGISTDHNSIAAKGQMALSGLVAVAVWLRLSSLRLLVWNHNYNVKPREISAALHRLGAKLIEVYEAAPQLSGVVLLALASAGRGGEGDMGQRIRDEILAIQHRNGCKGGMMEEWHQKLHNNSSPDDLAICQALLDYLAAGQDQQAYWDSLHAAGITAARLASYDRPIRSPPNTFRPEQVPQLTEDLIAYRRTLAAVHSGADLSAAVDGVLGYDAGECKGKRVKVDPLQDVATSRLKQLLSSLLLLVQGSSSSDSGSPGNSRPGTPSGNMSNNVVRYTGARNNSPGVMRGVSNGPVGVSKVSAMMDMERCLKLQALVVAARASLAPHIRAGNRACHGRLRDVLFLDMALELTGRGALEQGLAAVRAAAPSTLLGGLLALLQQPLASACLSALPGQAGNAALVAMTGQLQKLSQDCPGLDAADKARHALSLIERLRSLLAASSATASSLLQPTAWAVASALQIEGHQDPVGPVGLLAEEIVRGSAAAALSLLLTAVEPSLRRLAGVAPWSIVSRLPSKISGKLSPLTPCLSQLGDGAIAEPTVLVLQRLAGEEEVPPGVVGVVVLGDCPDVLSHAAVRARNCRVPVVACPSSEEAVVSQLIALEGKHVQLAIIGNDVSITEHYAEAAAVDQQATSSSAAAPAVPANRNLVAPTSWDGSSWVLTVDQFTPGTVGAKAMSAATLGLAAAAGYSPAAPADSDFQQLQLPPWLKVPPSIALPQGAFEKVLEAPDNAGMAPQLQQLAASIAAAEQQGHGASDHDLHQIRSLVQQLQPPADLQQQLQQQLTALAAASSSSSSSSAPSYSFAATWSAIQGVWASQWNDRALAALSKAQLPLQQLRMGVLLQPLLPARYSWVAHTVNPATGSTSEVAVQIVVGLGEVLVGNYPGRALSGVVKRDSLTAALQQGLGDATEQRELQQLRNVITGVTRDSNSRILPPCPDVKELLRVVDVVSHPSKDSAVVPQGMILPCELGSSSTGSSSNRASEDVVFMARSDSNAEDLPGFAGAGLFDSLPSAPTRSVMLDYSKEPMVWDRAAAAGLLWQCALAAVAAEQAVSADGGATVAASGQDVEGCVTADGTIWLLQARPQV